MADFQRNSHNGAPYVNHPNRMIKDGSRPARVMYGRPSNFGAQVENRFMLERWSERRIMLGAAIININGVEMLDPDDKDDATQLDGLVGEAKHAAGAHLAAARGTLTHEFTEYLDQHEDSPESLLQRAEEFGLPVKAVDATLEAYGRLLSVYDLHILAIEQTVVDDRWKLAGRLDRIGRLGRDLLFSDGSVMEAGEVCILDIKTGRIKASADGTPGFWHSYAVQLASYSHSVPYVIAEDSWDEARDEWPWEVSQRHALIVHLDINNAIEEGVATARLFHVDLVAGHMAGNLCRAARDWQSCPAPVHELAGHPIAVNVR